MKTPKEILKEIDATSLRPVAHKIIENAQKEAYNQGYSEAMKDATEMIRDSH